MKIKVFITALLILLPSCIYPNHEKSKPAEINNNQSYNEPAEILAVAESAKDNKKNNLAIDYYKKYLDLNPSKTKVRLALAQVYETSGKYDEAIAEYNKALEIDNNNTDIYYSLGEFYENQKKYIDALTQYKKALEIAPNNTKILNKIGLNISYDRTPNGLFKIIRPVYFDSYEPSYYFEKAISIDPKNTEFHNNLAKSLGNSELAVNEYQKSLELEKDNANIMIKIANIKMEEKMYTEAITYFEKAISLDYKMGNNFVKLGDAYFKIKDFSNSLKNYNKGCDIQILDSCIKAGNIRMINNYEKELEITPNNYKILFEMAKIKTNQKDYEDSIKYFQKAISINPNIADYYIELGNTYLKYNYLEGKETSYKKACELGRKDVCSSL